MVCAVEINGRRESRMSETGAVKRVLREFQTTEPSDEQIRYGLRRLRVNGEFALTNDRSGQTARAYRMTRDNG